MSRTPNASVGDSDLDPLGGRDYTIWDYDLLDLLCGGDYTIWDSDLVISFSCRGLAIGLELRRAS